MDVSKNSGKTPPQIIHLLIGFSIIFTMHFGGFPLFLETPQWKPWFFMVEKKPWLPFFTQLSKIKGFSIFHKPWTEKNPYHELHPRKANGWVSPKLGGVIDVPFGGILNREPFVTFGFQLFSLAGVG